MSSGAAPAGSTATAVRLGRLLSALEGRGDIGLEQQQLMRYPIEACIVGITGPPGSGKSTLVDALVAQFRAADRTVGVLAVDPSSPLTGGALLGDRIRMTRHAVDPSVFIRSMGSRGLANGLAPAVFDACRALAAHGYDPVLVETVGVGQVETGVVSCADVRVLVLTSASGDWVQAAKAGIIELADVIVVNKADLAGTRELMAELRQVRRRVGPDRVEVLATVATDNVGVSEMLDAVERCWQRLKSSGGLRCRRIEKFRAELVTRVSVAFAAGPLRRVQDSGWADALASAVYDGRLTASEAAAEMLAAIIQEKV